MKLGVFIPGRLSSERLPNKLILPLGESNLWDMACKKLEQLPRKYEKYALCYDKELVDIANKYDIGVILRDRDTAEAEGPLNYIFKDMNHTNCTHLMFLNPCLSFLSVDTIVEALETFEREGKDYATSAKALQNWIFDKKSNPINPINYERLTTKEINPLWQAAHCFHIFNTKNFFEDGQMLKEGHGLIPVAEEETIDVDTYNDYEYAKFRHAKKYVIDIDNTIFITTGTNYEDVLPNQEVIDKVNRLYEAGNTIVLNTARGYESKIDWRPLTEYQLRIFGVKYHALLFNKPSGDYYIDDKAINVEDWAL